MSGVHAGASLSTTMAESFIAFRRLTSVRDLREAEARFMFCRLAARATSAAARLDRSSGGDAQRRAQKLGSEVCAVRPNEGAQFRMNRELAKYFDVFQRLKDGTVQLIGEIDFPLGSIVESQLYRVCANVTTFNDVWQHGIHSNGSICGKGQLADATSRASQILLDSCKPFNRIRE
jgi:hypothetical protein